MGKTVYSDEDKAVVVMTLQVNGGNVKRTARETGIPEQTVRDWKKESERGETKPAVVQAVSSAADDFITDAERVRNAALVLLEQKIGNGDVKAGELNAIIGTLTDKINLARGLATSRQEQVRSGPSPEEIGSALKSWLEEAVSDAREREADIEDAEFEESAPAALPPAPTA